ncbi:MAG: leucine-rich repeat domain-containing protein [Spirochaetaceae bacterium]|jgi:hypothetical protein|nr:leucine-rich repeat domain-containing protein [Spirochaetaceae bacterium]
MKKKQMVVAALMVLTACSSPTGGGDESGSTGGGNIAITSIAEVRDYLSAASGGGSTADPVSLPVSLDLADTEGDGWTDLLEAIKDTDKYVALDLSDCTMSGPTFDPGADTPGMDKIVSLVLPDEATSIKAGVGYPSYVGLMEDFSALESISGAGIETIGANAFCQCYALKTVDFPAVETIGSYAFWACSGLTEVSLPASLSSIGNNPFNNCKNLESITVDPGNPNFKHSDDNKALLSKDGKTLYAYPSATSALLNDPTLAGITVVGFSALSNTNITAVNLPAAVSIDEQAFNGCTSLQTVSLPAAASIGNAAFSWTGNIALTVTLGSTAPMLGSYMFTSVTGSTKIVKVQVPSGATGYGTGTYNETDSYTNNLGNGFRGGGWNGSVIINPSYINSNISLTIEELP